MKFSVEIYAQKPLFLKDDNFISLSLARGGKTLEGTLGRDDYIRGTAMLSEKRLAGIGRSHSYDVNSRPIGLGAFDARPGVYVELTKEQLKDVALKIDTDSILDPAYLRELWGIRFVNSMGKNYDVPLARPDIQIHWDGRGSYTIPVSDFLCCKIMSPAC